MKLTHHFWIIPVFCIISSCTKHPTEFHQPQGFSSAAKTAAVKDNLYKNPLAIQFYTSGKPQRPYKVIGKETISQYNTAGIKRQKGNIHDSMRNFAAAIGGDAIINIKQESNKITGTIIAYQNKTLLPTTSQG